MKITKAFIKRLGDNPIPVLDSLKTDEVAQLIRAAANAYYNTPTPLFPDALFDVVKAYLEEKDPANPALHEVGAPIPTGTQNKATLPYQMASLDKIKDDPKALEKWAHEYPGSYVVSDKLDGISGLFVGNHLYTRGDGITGQDITPFIPSIATLAPLQNKIDPTIAVRGELIISRVGWERIRHLGANARNVVAGTMNAKRPNPEILREIEFVAYEIVHPRTAPEEQFQRLTALGFRTAWHTVIPSPAGLTMPALSQLLLDRRANSPYEVDGIVVYHNALHRPPSAKDQKALRNPRYGFAFKSILSQERAEVTVSSVEWNVSKDGYLKPVVHFPAVPISGVSISRATGFNAKYISDNLIGPGSRIIIIRSGDVIPYIQEVLTPAANGRASFPADMAYAWNESHVDILLVPVASSSATAAPANREMALRALEHLSSTLNIANLGPGILARLYDAGFTTIPALFSITPADIMALEGFQQKSASRLYEAIQKAKTTATCEEMMVASNLFGRGLGTKKIAQIIQAFPAILDQQFPSREQLLTIPGIGPATAEPFLRGLAPFFRLLGEAGIPCRKPAAAPAPVPAATAAKKSLAGVAVVFTGVRDKELEKQIAALGGRVATSVSKNTGIVVAKDPAEESGKIQKARELGIPVISLPAFRDDYIP